MPGKLRTSGGKHGLATVVEVEPDAPGKVRNH